MLRVVLLASLAIIGFIPFVNTAAATCSGIGPDAPTEDNMITVCYCHDFFQQSCGPKKCWFTAGPGSDPHEIFVGCQTS